MKIVSEILSIISSLLLIINNNLANMDRLSLLANVSNPPVELLSNPSFENVDPTKNDPIGWADNGFVADNNVARTGSFSYRITDAHLIPYSQSASQDINLTAGIYQASIWVKLSGMADTRGSGVRICLSAPPSYPWNIARKCSNIVKGTSGWQKLTIDQFSLPQNSLTSFSIETYGEPDGTAWFDDASLTVYQGPDIIPPSITITSPTNNQTVSGTITISANVTDNTSVAGVTFKIDNNNLGNEISTPPYQTTWDTTTVSNGQHTIYVIARDSAGNTSTSSIQVLVQNIDTTPPQISNVTVSNITINSAVITWTTNEQADSKVEYGTTLSYGSEKTDPSFVFNHSITLTGLSQDTVYNFRVSSKDSSGNVATSQNYTFRTQKLVFLPQCSDGLDNDLDGYVDYPQDPGCSSSADQEEFNSPLPPSPVNGLVAGGLLWFPQTALGPNILQNNSFESLDANGKPQFWSGSAAFSIDNTIAKSGQNSYRMKDAPNYPYTESASQAVSLRKGTYRISGWIKTNLQDPNPNDFIVPCVRLSLGRWGVNVGGGTTRCLDSTNDWTYVEKKNIAISQDATIDFKIESWNDPAGSAWFDDLELREELQPPVDVFMLYPNYRGYLFDDQSQIMRFDVKVNPPPGTNLTDYRVEAFVIDESNGSVVLNQTFPSANNFTATLNGSSLINNKTYLVRFKLVRIADNSPLYEYPAYRISKVPGSVRSSMVVSFDENNRILFRGEPKFIIGVYDSGLPYASYEQFWEDILFSTSSKGRRRLNELPINFYNNYWFGETPASAMDAMSKVLQRHGVYFIHTGNCFGSSAGALTSFPIYTNDTYLTTLSQIPGLAGFYIMDECIPELAPLALTQSQRLLRFKPDGINFGSGNTPASMYFWRDAIDLLSMDPYPLYGAEPQGGYNLSLVADWTKITKDAVKSSRPIATVIQFFQFTSQGRWPTKDELRNMSYMAIAEGANGLVYWSLGAGALGYICPDEQPGQDLDGDGVTGEYKQEVWCPERMDYFNRLKSVVQELNNLQPALSSIDRNDLLVSNSNPNIHTRVKYANGKGYLIAYNYTNTNQIATFTWAQTPTAVLVYNEARTLPLQSQRFTDNFGPYQAHVYEIYTSGAPPSLPSDITPPSAPTNLTATSTSNSQINLSWYASQDNVGVAWYIVERCQGSGCTNFTQITTSNTTSYSDNNLLSNTSYSYRVKAVDTSGNQSAYSNVASAKTLTGTSTQSSVQQPTTSVVSGDSGGGSFSAPQYPTQSTKLPLTTQQTTPPTPTTQITKPLSLQQKSVIISAISSVLQETTNIVQSTARLDSTSRGVILTQIQNLLMLISNLLLQLQKI